jgi:hypothetical protein
MSVATRAWHSLILGQVSDAVIAIDNAGRITSLNPSGRTLARHRRAPNVGSGLTRNDSGFESLAARDRSRAARLQ